MELECKKHGLIVHHRVKSTQHKLGYRYRCKACMNEYVLKRKQKVKQTLVEEAGGKCVVCGYNKCMRALHFHHIDPHDKAFELHSGITKSLDSQRKEATKCVLLCANHHAEVEAGILVLNNLIGRIAVV